jgi:membrane-associated phospholipid phosphatase
LSDVVCAAVLGILCAALIWRFFAREPGKHQLLIAVHDSDQNRAR